MGTRALFMKSSIILGIFFLALVFQNFTANNAACVIELAKPSEYRMQTYIYTDYFGAKQSFDYYTPVGINKPPLIIYIHGGAWVGGARGTFGARMAPAFMKSGYAFVDFDYPLRDGDKNIFPAAVSSLRCGLRHLNRYSENLGFDQSRVGMIGTSAGGNLASMLSYGAEKDPFFDGHYSCESKQWRMLKVDAHATFYGLYDLSHKSVNDVWFVKRYLAQENMTERASPINYVNSASPPTILIHGQSDSTVPMAQTKLLFDRLQEQRVESSEIIVKNAEHGFTPLVEKNTAEVDYTNAHCAVKNFFAQFLDN